MKKTAGYIHDLANLLMRVTGNYQLLGLEHPEIIENEKFQKVNLCLEDMVSMLRDFGTHVAQLGNETKHPPLELGQRFEDIREMIPAIETKYGIELKLLTDRCPENINVYSNSELGKRVTQNCIENACRAGATKMTIEYIAFETIVEVHINDNGSGMDDEQLKKIGFDYTTKETEGGNGISIVRNLVSEAGGAVEWKSIKNIGTSVIIRLRRAQIMRTPLKLVA